MITPIDILDENAARKKLTNNNEPAEESISEYGLWKNNKRTFVSTYLTFSLELVGTGDSDLEILKNSGPK